jgi:hypothetical protein
MSDQPRPSGEHHFPDGTTQAVFEDADSRQSGESRLNGNRPDMA